MRQPPATIARIHRARLLELLAVSCEEAAELYYSAPFLYRNALRASFWAVPQ